MNSILSDCSKYAENSRKKKPQLGSVSLQVLHSSTICPYKPRLARLEFKQPLINFFYFVIPLSLSTGPMCPAYVIIIYMAVPLKMIDRSQTPSPNQNRASRTSLLPPQQFVAHCDFFYWLCSIKYRSITKAPIDCIYWTKLWHWPKDEGVSNSFHFPFYYLHDPRCCRSQFELWSPTPPHVLEISRHHHRHVEHNSSGHGRIEQSELNYTTIINIHFISAHLRLICKWPCSQQ